MACDVSEYMTTVDTGIRRLRFVDSSAGPSEEFDGGQGFGNIFVPVADVSANIDAGVYPTTSVDMVFELPAGRYNLRLFIASDADMDDAAHFGIYKIIAGDDDIQVAHTIGSQREVTSGETSTVSGMAGLWNLVVDCRPINSTAL